MEFVCNHCYFCPDYHYAWDVLSRFLLVNIYLVLLTGYYFIEHVDLIGGYLPNSSPNSAVICNIMRSIYWLSLYFFLKICENTCIRPTKFTYIALIFFIMECSFSNYLYTLSRHIMFEFLSVWILKNEEGSRWMNVYTQKAIFH